jgi:phage terminase large subunit-like protein
MSSLTQNLPNSLTRAQKIELITILEEKKRRIDENQLARYKPYKKQMEFHSSGADDGIRERLLMAGNQLGKTVAGSFEAAMHLTGIYPEWWDGAKFLKPTTGWAASVTAQGTRDTVQRLLMGRPGEWGTGAIPKDCLLEMKRASGGVPDCLDTVTVKHITGGTSRLTFKTYDQGRLRWQGETLSFVWNDEEPPEDIYIEGLTRTNATGGLVWTTFTPLMGMSDVVRRFLLDKRAGTSVTKMTIDDAEHYSPEQRAAIVASYPAHEREARAKGIPTLGSGVIFPIAEENIREQPVRIPAWWKRIASIDYGWDHPTAVVWIAYDPDTDTAHVYDCYRVKEQTPIIHAAAIKAKGAWIPVVWPHDGLQHDKGSGIALTEQYRRQGVLMHKEKVSHAPDVKQGQKEGEGGNGVEAGLMMMLDRMQTGRLKVAAHLHDWWEEFRLYHREDGKVVKEGDDLMSATRYALMMLRHAKVQQAPQRASVNLFQSTVAGMGPLG